MRYLSDDDLRHLSTGRNRDARYPDPDADDLQRRVHAVAADAGSDSASSRRSRGSPTNWRHAMAWTAASSWRSSAGMSAAFLAMNSVFGPLFNASKAEAATPGVAEDARPRARRPVHLRLPDAFRARRLRPAGHHRTRRSSPSSSGTRRWPNEKSVDRMKFANYVKEIYVDSDTKVALLSGSPVDDPVQPVPDQRPDHRGAHLGQHHRALAPHAGALDHPADERRLARRSRPLHRGHQARQLEGLHHRRPDLPHQEGFELASRRRKARLSVLRKVREVRASTRSASTRACCRPTTRRAGPKSGSTPRCGISARPRRTGRRSPSSSITRRCGRSSNYPTRRSSSSRTPAASTG